VLVCHGSAASHKGPFEGAAPAAPVGSSGPEDVAPSVFNAKFTTDDLFETNGGNLFCGSAEYRLQLILPDSLVGIDRGPPGQQQG
jgi:hypothetical protein